MNTGCFSQLLIALALWGLLAPGCSRQEAKSPATQSSAGKKLKIGVSIPAADHGWTAGVGYWAQQAMKQHPDVEWVYATANEPGKQIGDIEDMMAQKVDGLVILATESAPLTPVAKKAHERGIYIVNVDRGFLEPVADVFIAGDNAAFGRKSAEFMAKKLDGKGQIVVLRGIPSTVDTARVNAFNEAMAKYPGIKILASQPGMWSQTKALEVMQAYLAQHKHIDAVWASDDDMALGVEKAIKEAGRQNEMWILGGAGMKDIIKRVMDNDPLYPADTTYPPAMIAAGIHLAVAAIRDGKLAGAAENIPEHVGVTQAALEAADKASGQRKVTLEIHLVTPDNAEKFYFPDSVY